MQDTNNHNIVILTYTKLRYKTEVTFEGSIDVSITRERLPPHMGEGVTENPSFRKLTTLLAVWATKAAPESFKVMVKGNVDVVLIR